MSFALPAATAEGAIYYLQARRSSGVLSPGSGAVWITVDQLQRTYPAVPPEQHKYARRIVSGQTVTGTFAVAGDPSGQFQDYNTLYFSATAGSRVTVSLERVDTSQSWEHPDSIDPQLEIVAPDGFVYQNLISYDRQPGIDLNAQLDNAILPATGIYGIFAETSKGAGEYRLHFTITSMAPLASGAVVLPFSERSLTIPAGSQSTPASLVLDPRGWPMSGAAVTYSTIPAAGDDGTVTFATNGTARTNPDGTSQTIVTAATTGSVQFGPHLDLAFPTAPFVLQGEGELAGQGKSESTVQGASSVTFQGASESTAQGSSPVTAQDGSESTVEGESQLTRDASAIAPAPIPRYQAVATRPLVVSTLRVNGDIGLELATRQDLPLEVRAQRHESRSAPRAGDAAATARSGGLTASSATAARRADRLGAASSATPATEAGRLTGSPATPAVRAGARERLAAALAAQRLQSRPDARTVFAPASARPDARTAVALPIRAGLDVHAQATASGCAIAPHGWGIVPAGTVLNPPFTLTFTDITQPASPEEIGIAGIHGHRIGTTVKLKLDIKDTNGQTPDYPVHVAMRVDGLHPGAIVLDPGGTPTQCASASFLWHAKDGNGVLIANDEFDLVLGTTSIYAGVLPDPAHPGDVTPVWGIGELLSVTAQAFAADSSSDPILSAINIHPEPGKPDHLEGTDLMGQLDDTFELWADDLVNNDLVAPWTLVNACFIKDLYGNTVWPAAGTTVSTTTPPGTTSLVAERQTAGNGDPAGYTIVLTWTTSVATQATQGAVHVAYPAESQDWDAGTVSRTLTFDFQRGTFHAVLPWGRYDWFETVPNPLPSVPTPYGADDVGVFPMDVSPAASGAALPKTNLDDTRRLAFLLVTGSLIPNPIYTPRPAPYTTWECDFPTQGVCIPSTQPGGDFHLETADAARFAVELIDGGGRRATEAGFRLHRCPRVDHDGPIPERSGYSRPCTLVPVDSIEGRIAEVIINPNGAAAVDSRGYVGIELTKAPIEPGTTVVGIEPGRLVINCCH